MLPSSVGENNPYLVLENTWQLTKTRGGASSTTVDNQQQVSRCRPVSPISIGGASSSSSSPLSGPRGTDDRVKRLNLSAICISNILLLEDRHLPSIFIRMYEQCLLLNEEDDTNADNKTRLRLLNYLIQRWHETRSRLNFYRDVMRVVGAVVRPVFGDHINIAIENTKIDQQHVMTELMKNLRSETAGRTLGEYLESYSVGSRAANKFMFNDMALELFTRNEVLAYEQRPTNAISSFLGDISAHPLASYGKRVIVVLLQAMCRLKLNVPTSVSNKLFAPSVPSWVEEDTETGMINCDEATRRRITEAKENITRLLLQRRRDKREAEKPAVALGTSGKDNVSSSSLELRPADKKTTAAFEDDQPAENQQTLDAESKVNAYLSKHVISEDSATMMSPIAASHQSPLDDELRTVDTESFLAYPLSHDVVAEHQVRTISALRHMEQTVQRVNTVDKQTKLTVSSSTSSSLSSSLSSDAELLHALGGRTAGRTAGVAVSPTRKKPRLSDPENIVSVASILPTMSARLNDDDDGDDDGGGEYEEKFPRSSPTGGPTVTNIRSSDHDLTFLARSGYNEELSRELETLVMEESADTDQTKYGETDRSGAKENAVASVVEFTDEAEPDYEDLL